jgi:predicted ribosome quality control (RQC) complex YloA/Tae2 family protein
MNGIYLHFLLREISRRLENKRVEDISVRDRIVQMVIDGTSLYVSLYPTALGLFLSKKTDQHYESVRRMIDLAKLCRIIEVRQRHLMPVCDILLEKAFPKQQQLEITVSFYPQAPNFSIRTAERQINIFQRYIEPKAKTSVLEFDEVLLNGTTIESLVRNVEGVDKKMAQELDIRNFRALKAMLKGQPVRPRLVSIKPLHVSLFAREYQKEFSSFNDLFEAAISGFIQLFDEGAAEKQRRLTIRAMKRRMARLQKRVLSPDQIEDLRVAGELILANIVQAKKGSRSIVVINPYTQKKISIDLDPHLSAQKNAQRYFARYKKEKRGQPRILEQIETISKEISDEKTKAYIRTTKEMQIPVAVIKKEPFHEYVFDSGSLVRVGKNARSNDELTFKYARSNDYFFHARGIEGAHVILRPNIPKGQRPSGNEIIRAASIAAYFSKARKQHKVPVSYTQRKYLKKNKKGKVGSVILMREDVVFVEPELPKR